MFNINITSSFFGVFPNYIRLSADDFSAAVAHYEDALDATGFRQGSTTTIVSNYGFSFQVAADDDFTPQSVRLGLPSHADRNEIATALQGETGSLTHTSAGIVVTDPFEITWTIA